MSIKPSVKCIIVSQAQIINQRQQPMTSNCQHPPIRSSLPKPQVLLTSPFKPQSEYNVLPESQKYDPQTNWQVSPKRTYENPNQSSRAGKIRKLSNINDFLTDEERKDKKILGGSENQGERIQP